MKVLIVAPRICTPWTEGRKKFVRDLIAQAEGRWELCGLVTIDAGESTTLSADFDTFEVADRKDHLLLLVRGLAEVIERQQPDLVCHFPFGAFTGVRGLGNLWVIYRLARICRRAGVPCCTIMYSLTSEADSWLHRRLLRDVYFNQHAGRGMGIRFGVRLPPRGTATWHDPQSRTLLFMAGAAEPSMERLDYVLDTRGLRLLLKAGGALTKAGFKLIVAIPFLTDSEMRERLVAHPDNGWNAASIELREEVRVPDIFRGVAAFVFPYDHEERQFVPTSIVEAMYFGIPTVFPRLRFLRQFHAEPAKGLVHEPHDVDSLVAQIGRLETDAACVAATRELARAFVDAEYDIANTVLDLETVYRNLRGREPGAA